ncbi:MAG: HTH domain-containing protein [Dehalococcoidia bacterium]|nr:HTH domain-containing protein [Dehalococcoidia bacterium]
MTILEYVERVLREANEPLHYNEITRRMLASGWVTRGATPWATVNSVLAMDVKNRGQASRFMRTTRGHFGLNPVRPASERRAESTPPATDEPTYARAVASPAVSGMGVEGSGVLELAHRVLADEDGPLHTRVITERMLALGWQTAGQRPWEIVASRLYMDVKQRGEASRFIRSSPGHFTLNQDPQAQAARPQREQPARVEGQTNGAMSFSDAAEHILRESGGQPMHYETITELALDQGLIQTTGLTPAATMYSVIYAENRRREARGQPPRFVMHGKGMVGLGAWVSHGLAAQIEAHNRGVREALLARVMEGSPGEFEELVGELLVKLGFEDVEVTPLAGDGGVDVRGTLVVGEVVRIRMAVQAKRWKHKVLAPAVQQVRGSLGAHEQGLIITTSDFSSGAVTEAIRSNAAPVALMNGEQLAALLAEQQIGVSREQHPLYFLEAPEEPEA